MFSFVAYTTLISLRKSMVQETQVTIFFMLCYLKATLSFQHDLANMHLGQYIMELFKRLGNGKSLKWEGTYPVFKDLHSWKVNQIYIYIYSF